MPAVSNSTARPRRWLQFRLRTLLALLLLSSLGFGYYVALRQEADRQRLALATTSQFPGSIAFYSSYEEPDTSFAAWARRQVGQDYQRVESLCLAGLSDADLERLACLTELRVLRLGGSTITDDGLRHLRGMTRLEDLNLNGSLVTDDGMASLAGLTNLKTLGLRDTGVSDAGLRKLHPLKNLKSISLRRTDVTQEGIADLATALPACVVAR
jgi:hypothetical protein